LRTVPDELQLIVPQHEEDAIIFQQDIIAPNIIRI